jgi:hypothetical protein
VINPAPVANPAIQAASIADIGRGTQQLTAPEELVLEWECYMCSGQESKAEVLERKIAAAEPATLWRLDEYRKNGGFLGSGKRVRALLAESK